MLEISNQWLLFVFDLSAKSLVLAVVAAVAMKLLRVRDSNLRHRIWSGVLLGMLALPLLSYALPTIPVSVPPGWNATVDDQAEGVTGDLGATTAEPFQDRNFAAQPKAIETAGTSAPVIPPSRVDVAEAPEPTTASVPAAPRWTRADYLRVGSISLFITWLGVLACFATRLLTGIVIASRIRSRAIVVSDEVTSLIDGVMDKATNPHCSHQVRGLVTSSTTVRESGETCVPVTVGWFRPTVLLPVEWRSWRVEKLQAIVAHELTHVDRRDFLVTLAAELNRCLYWFHPVSWWLRKQLSNLAEEACDDAAIEQTGDRTSYARHLLEVAAQVGRSPRRVIQPGLAMARESNVETRIATILDASRPLSGRVTWKTAVTLAVIGVPVIAATAAVHPGKSVQESTAALNRKDATETVRVHGQVVDENGTPITNATVTVWRVRLPIGYVCDNVSTKVGELKVDANGRFDQTFPKNLVPEATTTRGGQWSVLVAEAPGRAVSVMKGSPEHSPSNFQKPKGEGSGEPDFLRDNVTLTMKKSVPIRGKVVSLEGQPIAGAKVEVYMLQRPEPAKFTTWLSKTSKTPPKVGASMMLPGAMQGNKNYFPQSNTNLPHGTIAPVKTASDGTFELPSLIGSDDLGVLRVTHESITYQHVHVVGRELKTPAFSHGTTALGTEVQFFGNTPTIIAPPGVTVQGVVRDIDTKKPLADVWVSVAHIYGETMSQSGLFRTQTDSKGRYSIEGLPVVPQNRKDNGQLNAIEIRPAGIPYLETDFNVPVGDEDGPIEFNPELRKTVMAHGRLTNKQTGEPIANARLFYTPYTLNEHCKKYARYSDSIFAIVTNHSRYRSDKDGYFKLPVIPGRGVLAAEVDNPALIDGYGSKGIKAFEKTEDNRLDYTVLSDFISPRFCKSLLEINVPNNVTKHEVTMHVDSGLSLVAKFVDANNQPLTELENIELRGIRKQQNSEGQIELIGLEAGGTHPVTIQDRTAGLARVLTVTPKADQKKLTIQLLPFGQMTGRIVDPEGRPVAGANIEARGADSTSALRQVHTDAEGKFTYPMPVGAKYSVQVRIGKDLRRLPPVDLTETSKQIDLGDLVYDEYAERSWELKPKRAAKVTEISE